MFKFWLKYLVCNKLQPPNFQRDREPTLVRREGLPPKRELANSKTLCK